MSTIATRRPHPRGPPVETHSLHSFFVSVILCWLTLVVCIFPSQNPMKTHFSTSTRTKNSHMLKVWLPYIKLLFWCSFLLTCHCALHNNVWCYCSIVIEHLLFFQHYVYHSITLWYLPSCVLPSNSLMIHEVVNSS